MQPAGRAPRSLSLGAFGGRNMIFDVIGFVLAVPFGIYLMFFVFRGFG